MRRIFSSLTFSVTGIGHAARKQPGPPSEGVSAAAARLLTTV
jgi:hypothetical protein